MDDCNRLILHPLIHAERMQREYAVNNKITVSFAIALCIASAPTSASDNKGSTSLYDRLVARLGPSLTWKIGEYRCVSHRAAAVQADETGEARYSGAVRLAEESREFILKLSRITNRPEWCKKPEEAGAGYHLSYWSRCIATAQLLVSDFDFVYFTDYFYESSRLTFTSQFGGTVHLKDNNEYVRYFPNALDNTYTVDEGNCQRI